MGAFRKINDLDYIGAHLGYRYELLKRDVILSQENCQVKCSIINRGFAPCYRPMDVHLVLCDEQGNPLLEQRVETDIRTWLPETTIQLSCEFKLPENRPDRMILGIRLREQLTGKQIRLCNTPPLPYLINPIGEVIQ